MRLVKKINGLFAFNKQVNFKFRKKIPALLGALAGAPIKRTLDRCAILQARCLRSQVYYLFFTFDQ
jgi:uncharacterized membrane protein